MSLLWVALGLILSVNVGLRYAGGRPRMVWRCAPAIVDTFNRLSCSNAMHRQFEGEPAGPSPLSLSPPY
jgi:hypothetical protein